MTTPHPTGLVESRLLGDGHGRFGGRVRETDRVKARHRALTRSYSESLAFRLRPGNAGSNTAVDHIEVLGEAIAQIPDPAPAEPADHRATARAPPWTWSATSPG